MVWHVGGSGLREAELVSAEGRAVTVQRGVSSPKRVSRDGGNWVASDLMHFTERAGTLSSRGKEEGVRA